MVWKYSSFTLVHLWTLQSYVSITWAHKIDAIWHLLQVKCILMDSVLSILLGQVLSSNSDDVGRHLLRGARKGLGCQKQLLKRRARYKRYLQRKHTMLALACMLVLFSTIHEPRSQWSFVRYIASTKIMCMKNIIKFAHLLYAPYTMHSLHIIAISIS